MKRKNVRCVIESVGDGSIIKHYDEVSINSKLKHYDKDNMVTIYEPTEEQKSTLQELLYTDDKGETIKANALQIIYAMKLITDLEGLEEVTEEELIDTIQTPDRVLNEVNFEIGRIFTELISNHYEKLSVMSSLPKPILKAHLENEITRIESEGKREEKAKAKQELEEQMKALEAKMAELN